MDELMVLFLTPETKQQSKQWLEKDKLDPIKVKVNAARKKRMVLAIFDSKGLLSII
jgi:hypothetical protein